MRTSWKIRKSPRERGLVEVLSVPRITQVESLWEKARQLVDCFHVDLDAHKFQVRFFRYLWLIMRF
jgi:hypothetical protein